MQHTLNEVIPMTINALRRACNQHGLQNEFTWASNLDTSTLYSRLFGHARKVACLSYGLSPILSCPGMVLGKDSVCSDCYACRGRYGLPSPKQGHIRRLLAFVSDKNMWVEKVISQLRHHLSLGEKYVRIHDSGDFFSTEYIAAWEEIAATVPSMRFFAPTRVYHLAEYLPALQSLNTRRNVTVRPSALWIDQEADVVPGLSAPANVARNHGNCPAVEKHGTCVSAHCRKCWNAPEKTVTFRRHF